MSYSDRIHTENALISRLGTQLECLFPRASRFVAITDANVWRLYGAPVLASFRALCAPLHSPLVKVLPPGEQTKTRETKAALEDFMLARKCDRDCVVVALGGGVVGDLAGFLAATYLRGVPIVQVPTTLLAMVDSSIGGKTGVDTPAGKNLVGAFHKPAAVLCDPECLRTLSQREFCNGMAEVIKIAAIMDAQLFERLEGECDRLLERDTDVLLPVIQRAAQLKCEIVSCDERESGLRAVLNWGHTFGHAIEALLTPNLLHGEAVSIGMVLEAKLALRLQHLSSFSLLSRLLCLLSAFQLPTQLPLALHARIDDVLDKMRVDKKNAGARVRVVMWTRLGDVCKEPQPVDEGVLRSVLSPVATLSRPLALQPLCASITVPGSKSVSNRVLLLAALGRGECVLSGCLHSDDTRVMIDALRQMGVTMKWEGEELRVFGTGGKLHAPSNEIFLGNAGTAARFLTTAATLIPGTTRLDGVPRLRERPIADLTDALRRNGCTISFPERDAHFPLVIQGAGLPGGCVSVVASTSSQFVSSLLLSAPFALSPMEIVLSDNVVSRPFIEMTVRLMQHFGCNVQATARGFVVPQQPYVNPPRVVIEGDASSATYPLALAAVTGGDVTITNVASTSMQGDAAFVRVLQKMGCEVEQTETATRVRGPPFGELRALGEYDFSSITDTFITAAVLAAVARGQTRIVGVSLVANQRVKECNRLAAVVSELRKCGVHADETDTGVTIDGCPPSSLRSASVCCYNDHRIAMSFAVLAMAALPHAIITIEDKDCVDKTYPEFWHHLRTSFGIETNAPTPSPVSSLSLAARVLVAPEDTRSVIVVGMRGSGKSTMSRVLAERFGWTCADLDSMFVEFAASGRVVACAHNAERVRELSSWIETHGWPAFRQQEEALLRACVSAFPHRHVISTGGGIVETPGALDFLSSYPGVVVQLSRHIDDIVGELSADTTRAPLAQDVRSVWERRASLYEKCSSLRFHLPRGYGNDENWKNAEDAFVSVVLRRLTPLSARPLPPAPSFFVCATFDDYRNKEHFLPYICEDVHALEVRVDLLSDLSEANVLEQLALVRLLVPLPLIFTVRSQQHGGKYTGDEDAYRALLRLGLRCGCEFIDVEASHSAARRALASEAVSFQCRVIASYHHVGSMPSSGKLIDSLWLAQWLTTGASSSTAASSPSSSSSASPAPSDPFIIKIVAPAHSPGDAAVFLKEVAVWRNSYERACSEKNASAPPIIAVCTGEHGRRTRLLNRFLSPVTHPLLPAAAAPGQLTVDEWRQAQCATKDSEK